MEEDLEVDCEEKIRAELLALSDASDTLIGRNPRLRHRNPIEIASLRVVIVCEESV
jgi:hypothetical protein